MDTKYKKILGLSAAAGFTLPVLLLCAAVYLETYGLADTSAARLLFKIGGYLWPTAIYLMDTGGLNFQTLGALLYSATLNGLIYVVIAGCGYGVWQLLAGPKDDGWWPSKPDR